MSILEPFLSGSAVHRLCAVLVAGLCFGGHAFADCDLEIRRVDSPAQVLNPFDGRARPVQIIVEIANRGTSACDGVVVLRDEVSAEAGRTSRDGIELEFYERNRTARSVPGSLAAEEVRVDAGKTAEIKFTPQLSFARVPLRGERRFELAADIIDLASNHRADTDAFDLRVDVAASTAISLAGMKSDQTIDLGDLRLGGTGNAVFYVQSNGPYKMTIRSENQGRLLHTEDESLGGVDYRVTAGRRTSSLKEAVTVFKSEATPLLGERTVLGFRTPANPLLYAGTYRDVIEVEVTPY